MNALCPDLAPFLVARVERPARTLTREDPPAYRDSTLKAIEQRLLVDGFVRRYEVDADDGLPPGEGVFLACWLSVAVTAAAVHLPRGPQVVTAVALSLNAGIWLSAVVTLSGSSRDLWKALPWVLVFLPASWLVERRASIAVKVISSWLIAVAVLAAALQFLPVTPGYLPDHLE